MDESRRSDELTRKRPRRAKTKDPEIIEANEYSFKELAMEKTSSAESPVSNLPMEKTSSPESPVSNHPMEKTSSPESSVSNHPTERPTKRIDSSDPNQDLLPTSPIQATGNTPAELPTPADDFAKLKHLDDILQSESDNIGSPGENAERYDDIVRSFQNDLS
ncbi:hypothetical protein KP509_23G050100 [Ceratopteris richardii]|uniref:Uncharacterized protein n=1 Tax=Ceratopteris richardii TaxID=49495 RepID=A0A8T2S2N7_CERRI|nr:hypothetical protein KP509_23G050100 [Ceratopteris richardii]